MAERIAVRVTPRSKRNTVSEGAPSSSKEQQRQFQVHVTAVPEDGKANAAVIKLLAKHLGIAKSQITLVRRAMHRDKVFDISA